MSNFARMYTNSPDQLDTVATQVATFNVGSRITAIAWSSRTVSPSFSEDWSIESVKTAIPGGLDLSSHHFAEQACCCDSRLWTSLTLKVCLGL